MKMNCVGQRAGLIGPLLLVISLQTAAAAVWHVATNGNDAATGLTWAEARRTVSATLNAAAAGDDIWVARGLFFERVTLKPGVALYGGFAGTETALNERDWTANPTFLMHTNGPVVTVTNADRATRLDGFTVTGGIGIHGGGIKTIGAAPVIANNTIRQNITDGAGAGISVWHFYIQSSTNIQFPLITNNFIVENQAINDEGDGAGIAVIGSSPVIAGNVIARNTATRNGGGIACWRHSLPVIANNFILANSASYDELTASAGGGGIFASATDLDGRPISGAVSAPWIINNVIAANGGNDGGGVTVVDSLLGAATLINNTIAGNNGAGLFWANTHPTNDNNLVVFNAGGFARSPWFTNEAVLRHNNVFGNTVRGAAANYHGTADRTGSAGNISAEPRFANFAIGDFHLQPDSPCVNAGSTTLAVLDLPDLEGQSRVQGVAVDIGADESDGTAWDVPTPVVRVSPAGDDTDGSTWAKAKRTVTAGIARAALTGGEVWVAQGVYPERVELPAFVQLFGGFAGNEQQRSQRDVAAHPTVLDGGGLAPVVYFRNAGHQLARLDGFTVRGGGIHTGGNVFHPDLTNRFGGRGGGIYCRVSGPVIAGNLVISNSLGSPFHSAESYGAGLYAYLSHAEITGNTFRENEVLTTFDGAGGGVYCRRSEARIAGNQFRFNRARYGAAIYGDLSALRVVGNLIQSNAFYPSPQPTYMGSVDGAVTLRFAPDLLMEGNTVQGNIAVQGAGLKLITPYAARVVNNLFLDNLAWDYSGFGSGGQGGGLACNLAANATGQVVIAHNTFVGNQAPPSFLGHLGGGLALTLGTNGLLLANNIIASNSSGIWRYPYLAYEPVLRHNCVHNSNAVNYVNLAPGAGDVSADPQFISRAAGDFRLNATSPAIDAGTNGLADADFAGMNRPLDGNADGLARADMGAFEFVHATADTDADGMGDAAERVAGTNPTDPASVLRLGLRRAAAPDQAVIAWPSVAGRSYAVWTRPGPLLTGDPWELWLDNVAGTGGMLESLLPVETTTNRWYRVQVREP